MPYPRRFPLPPGEGQGKGGREYPYGWAPLSQPSLRGERGREASPGTTASSSAASPKQYLPLAHFLTLCRASHLAEARRLSSPFACPSHDKRQASPMPLCSYVPQLRPSTNC